MRVCPHFIFESEWFFVVDNVNHATRLNQYCRNLCYICLWYIFLMCINNGFSTCKDTNSAIYTFNFFHLSCSNRSTFQSVIHFFDWLKIHSIRTVFLNKLLKPAHTPTSISEIIFAISSRSTCSRATISSISALSLTISIFSLVSLAST